MSVDAENVTEALEGLEFEVPCSAAGHGESEYCGDFGDMATHIIMFKCPYCGQHREGPICLKQAKFFMEVISSGASYCPGCWNVVDTQVTIRMSGGL